MDEGVKEEVVFKGKIGEIIHASQPDGRIFERYSRPPGTRLIIISSENKILITKEFRPETNNYDLRLPGGKVCDSLEQFNDLRSSDKKIEEAASEAAIKEAREETGLIVKNPELLTISRAGTTVEWDLYYYLITSFEEARGGQNLEEGEDIEVNWLSIKEVELAIKEGRMQEWRSAGVLLGLVIPKYT